MELVTIAVSAMLVNNFILSRFLGICPFLGVSKKVETATGMTMAVAFVMTLASIMTYFIQVTILDPFNLQYLQTIAFILIIASLVQFVEMFIKKASPTLYEALGVYLPLITTNCAVLGLTLLNIQEGFNLLETIVHGVFAAIGFGLAIILFAGIRERLALADVPESLEGFPIALITAGLMSIAFLGFAGLV
ncbi:electron transport complex subunit RsxA [Senegalia massiliensis]|jgi:electron transport complex protein RnfA|uniref:electron transport complex subunit RsxA n=1 Tax=Senegalia massiliensis TaxID=1720316 RepID=UPI00103177D8|nr:electron transport complex subunit RsxA [Senegalia massiliensis]